MTVLMEVSLLEAAHLNDLITQFAQLLEDTDAASDPAVARLVPDAYREDDEAAREFRRLTEDDLLGRRRDDAAIVASTLLREGEALDPRAIADADAQTAMVIELDDAATAAWLRTLTSLRLVLANRLGITTDDLHDDGDPRFGVYDWLGYRLDGLLQALEQQ